MGKRKVTRVETEQEVRTLERCDFCRDKATEGSFNEIHFDPGFRSGMQKWDLDDSITLDGFLREEHILHHSTRPELIQRELKHLDDSCFDAFREGLDVGVDQPDHSSQSLPTEVSNDVDN